jgi:hypothetical protein
MNAKRKLIDNSLIKKVKLAQLGFFRIGIYWSVYSQVELNRSAVAFL